MSTAPVQQRSLADYARLLGAKPDEGAPDEEDDA
jgi:hypothetical protein